MSAMKRALPESEAPEAKRDAIAWLADRAMMVAKLRPDWAEGCIGMAYDIDPEIAADEMTRVKKLAGS